MSRAQNTNHLEDWNLKMINMMLDEILKIERVWQVSFWNKISISNKEKSTVEKNVILTTVLTIIKKQIQIKIVKM